MGNETRAGLDVESYLTIAGPDRSIFPAKKNSTFFSQGDPADSVFYLQKGRVRISVLSPAGKEATIRLVTVGDFFGEKAMEAEPGTRNTTATAITDCIVMRIERPEFLRVMRQEPSFSYRFSSFLLSCSLRHQADLVDQLFNRAEKRLARLLLLLAEQGQSGEQDSSVIPPFSQEALANMIGSTRPRVNGFLSRFRKLGYIEYNGGIHVRKSLLNVFLHD
jgi:CRP/FNR family cyclic AMP-dependent transcriptional regulator